MADMRNFSKTFMMNFIEIYRSYPCLWQTKSKDYTNRTKKDSAYQVLLKKLQEIEPNATTNTVKAKINSMRGSFRREMKKVVESKRSGAAIEEVYEPNLWYYDLLLFTKNQEHPHKSVSNLDESDCSYNEANNEELYQDVEDYECETVLTPSSRSPSSSLPMDTDTATPTPSSSRQRSMKKRKTEFDQQADEVLTMVGERLRPNTTSCENPCNIFGKNVAAKLNTLPKETRLYTEKLINDLLFEAEMGNVNRNTKIVNSTNI